MGHGSGKAHVPPHLPSYCLLHLKYDAIVTILWVHVIPSRGWILLAESFSSSKASKEKVANIKSMGRTVFFKEDIV